VRCGCVQASRRLSKCMLFHSSCLGWQDKPTSLSPVQGEAEHPRWTVQEAHRTKLPFALDHATNMQFEFEERRDAQNQLWQFSQRHSPLERVTGAAGVESELARVKNADQRISPRVRSKSQDRHSLMQSIGAENRESSAESQANTKSKAGHNFFLCVTISLQPC